MPTTREGSEKQVFSRFCGEEKELSRLHRKPNHSITTAQAAVCTPGACITNQDSWITALSKTRNPHTSGTWTVVKRAVPGFIQCSYLTR